MKGANKKKGKSGFQGRKSCSMHHDDKNGKRGIMEGHNGRTNTRQGGKAKGKGAEKVASKRCVRGSQQNGSKGRQ